MKAIKYYFLSILFLFSLVSKGQELPQKLINKNKPERELWLQNAGFGMFIHWGIDSQLGTVISHSLVGASEGYINKYIEDLPKTFNPTDWNPTKIVSLAKNAGMQYIVFTAKHHSGFCFWDTQTTDFKITNTPYQKDILSEFVAECRKWGLAVGFYFSSEDFVYSYRNGIKNIQRVDHWKAATPIQKKYATYMEAQAEELLTQFGPIDIFFLDSEVWKEEIKALVWKTQPNCLITRGAILTPEQFIPGEAINKVWESNMTMGTQWNYKPTNEHYKSGTQLINLLIEARAKGGTYMLNIGPDQWGNLNEAQQGRLMEIAAWNFVNHEAIQNVRPWIISNEGDIWFSKNKDDKTVYAYLTNIKNWVRGDRKTFLLKSVKATTNTEISVLGQTGNVIEYNPGKDGKAYVKNTDDGLEISVVRAQRIYNNHRWPNPIVVKLENVEPAFQPAKFKTLPAIITAPQTVQFQIELLHKGDSDNGKIGIQYRPLKSTLEEAFDPEWKTSNLFSITEKGTFTIEIMEDSFPEMPLQQDENAKKYINASFSQQGIEYRAIYYQDGLKIEGNILSMK